VTASNCVRDPSGKPLKYAKRPRFAGSEEVRRGRSDTFKEKLLFRWTFSSVFIGEVRVQTRSNTLLFYREACLGAPNINRPVPSEYYGAKTRQ
jgi:hypothetical protein